MKKAILMLTLLSTLLPAAQRNWQMGKITDYWEHTETVGMRGWNYGGPMILKPELELSQVFVIEGNGHVYRAYWTVRPPGLKIVDLSATMLSNSLRNSGG